MSLYEQFNTTDEAMDSWEKFVAIYTFLADNEQVQALYMHSFVDAINRYSKHISS